MATPPPILDKNRKEEGAFMNVSEVFQLFLVGKTRNLQKPCQEKSHEKSVKMKKNKRFLIGKARKKV